MKRLKMTTFSVRFPWIIILAAVVITVLFGSQFPKVSFDNDPENMLADDEQVRVFHTRVKAQYNLYDFVIVGIVNEAHEDGIFNVETLGRIDALTKELISLRQNAAGLPEVVRDGQPFAPGLESSSAWNRALSNVFGNDVNWLFDNKGNSAIIAQEIISPSVVDNIKQADHGQLAIEYLMEDAPTTREEALTIRNDAMNNPLYKGTLVAEDGKAIALYIPITEKTYSYNVANLVEKLTEDWSGDDQVYITGQPVAQDTFGVEMLVQMATSAPLAGLAIFLLLLFFFRRVSLIIAPMLVAIVSVVATMGLLIGLGFDVHIMSSMIAIFLMPIAVADSVHILSEFFDTYHRFQDKAKTIKHVVGRLFKPMLYTSLTTIAGFASLATTPIPPVRVFGLHVAFGVALAWLLTMTFVPAYIMLFVRKKSLEGVCQVQDQEICETKPSRLDHMLTWLGGFSYARWKLILAFTMVVVAISAVGISKIKVNDNPIKWFTQHHRIRVADRVLNDHFAGTYTAYLTLKPELIRPPTCAERIHMMRNAAIERFSGTLPEASQIFLQLLDEANTQFQALENADIDRCFVDLVEEAKGLDEMVNGPWNALGDEINYLDPEGLTYAKLAAAMAGIGDEATRGAFAEHMQEFQSLEGAALQNQALDIIDEYAALSFTDFLFEARADAGAPAFKKPEMLAYVERLQAFLAGVPNIGKTSSALDALKKANYELNFAAEGSPERNDAFYSIPPTPSAVAQVFTQLEGMKKKDSLFHLITKDYNEVNLWIQLKSGDNTDMQAVVDQVEGWMAENPAPTELDVGWAGLTYLNVVWQDKMVAGMMNSLLSSFVVVLIMMMVLFRSPLYGLLAMIPLSVTITFIYGLIGWVGKDYDMPVAILSSLTLGLSVDFAIHFLERARELTKKFGGWKEAVPHMFQEPAMAISRNAIIISIGFTPLLFAPLMPYKTVGFFLATIMAVSWLGTLFILAALITGLQKYLFKHEGTKGTKEEA
ncbi:efflux RND transporter permease subunit [Pontiella sulfatireligans]|uniref:Acyltrehalose exporter MmpL10 n=1 Tax=Pontiella sulfatireligans TaxID=2750658 RepID=A0A6C2UPL6_9BACT|nr:MMPL family transporter [Pontiella sulfatireligans]VGO22232.1 Acyltrehalose exporter MmpL10 [Pontiella sulfatireligans]